MNSYMMGIEAENLVSRSLRHQGWKILSQRYRTVGSEIDVISLKEKVLLFIEVKYRSHFPKTSAELEVLVSKEKKESLLRGIDHFLCARNIDYELLRCDLVLVTPRPQGRGLKMKLYNDILC